mgnify:CR=1 FL=1
MSKPIYTEREYKKAYKSIKKILLEQKSSRKYPLATLVGGQPGSGKSQLTRFIQSQDNNTIVIDGDYIREFHPRLEVIKNEFGINYPKITQPFVNRAVEQFIDEFSKEKYNLVIEGTLRDINVPLKTATELDERDYVVELYVVATNQNLSWQSTIDRGNKMKEQGKVPRYVDKEHHDNVVNSLPETVKMLTENDLFYNVVIMRRDQAILYEKAASLDLDPKKILKNELNGKPVLTLNERAENQEPETPKVKVDDLINEVSKDAPQKHKNKVIQKDKDINR